MRLPLISFRPVAAAFATLFFAATALADVILVDQSGAPDADYTDLPPALAAAQHNDLILVRDGSYSGFSTGKGVRILGIEEGVTVGGEILIDSLEGGRKFAMSLVFAQNLKVSNCQGHVSFGVGRRDWGDWWPSSSRGGEGPESQGRCISPLTDPCSARVPG